jgi:phosphoenolpyruvate-protein phosphotransferase/dihydroxyacetone kinase phosphotransfer subunit
VSRVGLVVVSHSLALAEAAVALAEGMVHGQDVSVEIAAGLDDGTFGTDATAIAHAVTAAERGDGVVVLMDLGSAVLSADLALELLDDAARERVLLCPAPLVEGLVAAAVTAAGGGDRHAVAVEALAGLAGKQSQLSGADPTTPSTATTPAAGGRVGSFTVADEHGLHARPAARLVQEAGRLGARVEVRNATTGSGWVPATSLSQVATLGALQGHEVQVRTSGPAAEEALDALLALAVESDHTRPAPPPARGSTAPLAASGAPVPASPGIGMGPARLLRSARPEVPDEVGAGATVERERLDAARTACRDEIRSVRATTAVHLGQEEAAVFDAHLLLLEDSDLLADVHQRITGGQAAAPAWAAAVDRVAAAVAALPDPYQQARAADVRDTGDQVLRQLLGGGPHADDLPAEPGVLVTSDLTPAQAASLDPLRTTGLVLAGGSPTSHSMILARARGVPAVVGAGPAVLDTPEGTLVALDGATGELVIAPGASVQQRFHRRASELAEADRVARQQTRSAARTRDGVHVLVAANLGSVADAHLAVSCGADLAGLVRTEFLFSDRDTAPDVEEQEAVYRDIGHALGGRLLTLRTLDVGGDKPLRYQPVAGESDPFLGVRGIRLSLARPGLLADQLLAVVRVAHDTPVRVMFPMISTVAELVAARQVLDAAITREGRGAPPGLEVGMMVEVPAAALKTASFAPYVDFVSIGTNDLTQYTLAAARGNAGVAGLADPYDPGVLSLIATVCAGAGRAAVAVCGEMAADELATPLLLGLGVGELSVTPRAVPAVKQAVRAVDRGRAAVTAARALRAEGPGQVRTLLAGDTTQPGRGRC